MNHPPIILNRLKSEINWEKLKENYSIFSIPNDKFFEFAKKCSIESCFSSMVLIKREEENNLLKYATDNNIEVESCNTENLGEYKIIRLLLNALQKSKGPGYAELSGRLFYCDEDSIYNKKYQQIHAQEVCLDQKLTIWFRTVTLTAYAALEENQKEMIWKRKVPYVINNMNSLNDYNIARVEFNGAPENAKLNFPLEDLYYIYQPYSKPAKSRIFYSTLANKDIKRNYKKCRCHLLYKIIECFNRQYEDIVSLSFEVMEQIPEFLNTFCMENGKRKSKESYYERAERMLSKFAATHKFNIIHNVEDREYAEQLATQMKKIFSETKIFFNNEMSEDHVQLIILHNKEYYEKTKIQDPYAEYFHPNMIIQDITLELLAENLDDNSFSKAFLEKIMIECMIKEDILKGEICFLNKEDIKEFDTTFLRFISCRVYSKESSDSKNKINKPKQMKIFVMTYYLDTLQVDYEVYDSINDIPFNLYESIIDLFDLDNINDTVKFIVENDMRAFKIEDTHMFPLPDDTIILNEIQKGLDEGTNVKFRNKKNSLFITNLLDLKMFYGEDEYGNDIIYYFTSLMGSNLKSESIPKAPCVRKVTGIDACNLFRKYRAFIEVNFITSNNRFTVYPFQFKYLNEYIKNIEKALIKEKREKIDGEVDDK